MRELKAAELNAAVRIEYPSHSTASRAQKATLIALLGAKNGKTTAELEVKFANKTCRRFSWSNMTKLFLMQASSGKATIRFSKPEIDVIISNANPVLLHSMLMSLKKGEVHKSAARAAAVKEEPAVTSIKVSNLADFKEKILSPKLREVRHIEAVGVKLRNVYPQVLDRPRLMTLNLAENCIRYLSPWCWNRLDNLTMLVLKGNQLTVLPGEIFSGNLRNTLTALDVSNNKLKQIPAQVFHMKKLGSLDISNNLVTELPESFGFCPRLLYFRLNDNPFGVLPATLLKLTLHSLHYGRSPDAVNVLSDDESPPVKVFSKTFPKFKYLAAQAVLKHVPEFGVPAIPLDVVCFLGRAKCCFVCGKPHFVSFMKAVKMEAEARFARAIKSHVLTANEIKPGSSVPVQYNICSVECISKFEFQRI